MSTRPVTLQAGDHDGLEVQAPEGGSRIPQPKNLQAAFNGAHAVRVTWDVPGAPYDMIILRDGVEVGRMPASSGQFLDVPTLDPGLHVYAACFGRGSTLGPEAATTGLMPDLNIGGHDDSGPDFGE